MRAVGAEPVGSPVEGAEKRACGHGRLGTAAALHGDERAHPALVSIALGDDSLAKGSRQSVHLQMSGRAFDPVDEAQDVRDGEVAEPRGERPTILRASLACGGERVEQTVQRSILAEEQQLFLAAEVVIEVAGRQVRGDGNVPHARGAEAPSAKDGGRGAHDLHATRLGALRTAVRKVNHGSIVADSHHLARLKPSRSIGRAMLG